MALLLKRPSLLAPPGGSPGFSPLHPASQGVRLSAVSFGTNFSNLLNGQMSTQFATPPTATIDGRVGLATKFGTTSSYQQFSGFSSVTPIYTVMSAIIVPTAADLVATFAIILDDAADGLAATLLLIGFNGGVYINPTAQTRSGFFPPVPLVANTPYFICWVSNINFCAVTNLQTGVVQSGYGNGYAANQQIPLAPTNSACTIGNNGNAFTGSVAAVAISYQAFSIPAALGWAADPWSFWYPNNFNIMQSLKTPAGTAATVLMAAQAWGATRRSIEIIGAD